MQGKLKTDHNAEIPAATLESPKQVWVFKRIGVNQLTIGSDHIRRDQVVDRQPMFGPKPADATGKR